MDMEFNLGHPRFSKFHDTIAAINDGDYVLAAGCMKASEWYREVGRRGIADCKLMESAAVIS
jgi:lysozyme